MEKSEFRRQQLIALIDALGRGGITLVAKQIDKEPSYVSRMLYEPSKPGKKRITEASADLISEKFPGWLENPVAAASQGNRQYPVAVGDAIRSHTAAQASQSVILALQTLAQWVAATDDLTRDQIKPLISRMLDEPQRSAEIAARISATIQTASPAPVPNGLSALLTEKHKKSTLDVNPPSPKPP